MKLNGKTALVTGAARRIGRSIALTLASAGASVLVHTRIPSADADETLLLIQKLDNPETGTNAELVYQDLSNPDSTDLWFRKLMEQGAGVDILVNSACSYPADTLDSMSGDALEQAMAVQVLSPLVMMRHLKKSGRPAQIINILDARVMDRNPNHASYHFAKRSLWHLTRDLALEYAPVIRVNSVAPGIILPIQGKGREWLNRMSKSNPLRCCGNPEDVANAVLYLAQADFVTGQVIFVDGGRHLLRGTSINF